MKSYFKIYDRQEQEYMCDCYGFDYEFETENEAQDYIDETCSNYMSDFHLSQLDIEEYIYERNY